MPFIYNLGRTTNIITFTVTQKIVDFSEYIHILSRWYYNTIDGRQDRRITIINAFRLYISDIDKGKSTSLIQQWFVLEELNLEREDIQSKIIIDFISLVITFQSS